MTYSYCPNCGEKYTDTSNIRAFTCTSCGFIFYNNPNPAAVALIRNENGDVLLTKRKKDPRAGYWDFPGGFIEYGESPQEALTRELQEELGVHITITGIHAAHHTYYNNEGRSNEQYSANVLTFTATLNPNQIPSPGDDVVDYKFFPLTDLPKNIAFPQEEEILRSLV